MTNLVLERPRPLEDPFRPDHPTLVRPAERRGKRVGIVMAAAGCLALGLAFAAPRVWNQSEVSGPYGTGGGSTPRAAQPALVLRSPLDVNVLRLSYEPGQESGWHTHPGIHAVAVLSGTLTVYDRQCQAKHYGPGQSYVGGQEVHLVRNETPSPAELVVTYLHPAEASSEAHQTPAPAACAGGVLTPWESGGVRA